MIRIIFRSVPASTKLCEFILTRMTTARITNQVSEFISNLANQKFKAWARPGCSVEDGERFNLAASEKGEIPFPVLASFFYVIIIKETHPSLLKY